MTPAEPLLAPGTPQRAFRDAPLVNVGKISSVLSNLPQGGRGPERWLFAQDGAGSTC